MRSKADTLERLSLDALHEGYFVRGAVCRGLLFHDKQMVFGEALINAHRLETEVANYPRIMLTKQVFDDAMSSNLKQYFVDHIKQADDGPYFVHIFQYLQVQLEIAKQQAVDTLQPDLPFFRYMTIREMIQEKFNDSVDNPRHFEKIQWLANYWNVTFGTDHPNFKWITGPGLFQKRFLST